MNTINDRLSALGAYSIFEILGWALNRTGRLLKMYVLRVTAVSMCFHAESQSAHVQKIAVKMAAFNL